MPGERCSPAFALSERRTGSLRGVQFTRGQTYPAEMSAAGGPKRDPAMSVFLGVLLAAVVIALVVGVAYFFVTADDGLDCATENADRSMAGRPAKDCD